MRLNARSGDGLSTDAVHRFDKLTTRNPVENNDSTLRKTAIDPATFDRCMAALGPFEEAPLLAVAVSGGPDSLALTLLTADWTRRRGGQVIGLTVDHGLRPESAEEARVTGLWLGARGITHHILRWTGEKPKAGLQQHARTARYALLADWCRKRGCLHLLTAHHRGDQAETVAMRQARKSGPNGLAGMASVREIDGLRLLRPLLGIDKAALIESLRTAGQPWFDDPSNRNPAFARTSLRNKGLDTKTLAAEAARWGDARRSLDLEVAACLAQLAILDPAGFATLDASGFAACREDLAAELLIRLLMTIGGSHYPPRGRALSPLLALMQCDAPDLARTLAHCRIRRLGDRWLICNERITAERLLLIPGEWHHWNGRFRVRLRTSRPGLVLRALDDKARHGERTLAKGPENRRLPASVERTLPSLWDDHRLIAIPHLGLFDACLATDGIDLRFCPRQPLANAPFAPHMTV